ncbi:transposase [Phycicoccus sp. DTK01]|uniref:transposase n=1 Tax=Phycicoccus sp. DTK01 TaxID=2785745 RepID=UPI001A9096B9|nr:hypothetical protein PDTK01_36900 [Phycicoccus sp. DTK01]
MPAPKPLEFRRRAVELTRVPGASVATIAKDLGISETCLRRWMAKDDVDAGRREGLTSSEHEERSGCEERTAARRWRSRSSSVPRPTSRRRTCCPQNERPAGP